MARPSRVRFQPVPHQWPVLAGAGVVALGAGRLAAQTGSTIPLGLLGLAALAGGIAMFMLRPERLLLGWLVLAPLLGNSADASGAGFALRWGFYLAPVLVFVPLTLLAWRPVRLRLLDVLPVAFALYVFVAILTTSDLLRTDTVGTGKAYFQIFVIPAIVYYFLVFGPGREISPVRICAAVLAGAATQTLLTFVEWQTAWNLWDDASWRRGGDSRPVSTLSNPGVLGMFIGVGVVVALAIVAWRGPRKLRWLSVVVLMLGVPTLALTLTRGPIIATALVGCSVLVASKHARLVGFGVIALSALALVLLWPTIAATHVYQDRLTNQANVQGRVLLQDWSLRLAAEKPITGWGYQSFDRVKNASDYSTQGLPPSYVLDSTSHDSFLTVLVEYGSIGFVLWLLPWAVIVLAGIRAVRRFPEHDWLLVASVAAVLVIAITGGTLDYRFFSFALMLPWVFLAMIRRTSWQ